MIINDFHLVADGFMPREIPIYKAYGLYRWTVTGYARWSRQKAIVQRQLKRDQLAWHLHYQGVTKRG